MNKDIRINNGILQIDMDDLKLDERYATLDHVYDIEYRMISDKNSIKDIYTKSEVEGRIWDEVQNLRDEWKTSINNTTYQLLKQGFYNQSIFWLVIKQILTSLKELCKNFNQKKRIRFIPLLKKYLIKRRKKIWVRKLI